MQRVFVIFILLFCLIANYTFSQDLLPPDLKSVSINPGTGNILVKWTKPDDENVTHIEISRRPYAGNLYSFDSIGAVYLPGSVFIDNDVTDINEERQTYRIRSANDIKYSAITSMHLTMTINAVYNACGNEIEVRWNPYKQLFIDANGKIVEPHEPEETFNKSIKYEVWGYAGSGTFNEGNAVKLGNTVSGTVDVLEDLSEGSKYHLFVKALLPNGDTASSYRMEVETTARRAPSYMNIDSVISVNGTVELYFGIDKNTQLDTFALYRNDEPNKPIYWFRDGPPAKHIDRNIQLGLSYNYHLGVFRCGKLLQTTDTVNNILLMVNSTGQSTLLRWAEFTNKPAKYELTRIEPEPEELVYSATDIYTCNDEIKPFLEDGFFRYCYSLEADNGQSLARSEPQCITVEPIVNMPDAIDPLSDITNPATGMSRNRFGPILLFKDDKYRFTLEVFNKAGIRIFASTKEFTDMLSPFYHYWDGRYNNDYVREDVYIYSLKFEFKNRKPYTQNGTVTVVYRQ
ncbi:MAG: hypothetical protein LBL90_14045 [Prevotellaceae bacterium]|jgi:hypothetical protein|nr:hypothetical protein [Prevotellaceae bacterium]